MSVYENGSVESHLVRCCSIEFEHWAGGRVSRRDLAGELERLNNIFPGVFIFRITGGEVLIDQKPENLQHRMLSSRAVAYGKFFKEVVKTIPTSIDIEFALQVADAPLNSDKIPTFSFQKKIGDRTILLNDVNIIEEDFYDKPIYFDPHPFGSKIQKAIFVGSTSGASNTLETIRTQQNPRIEAALFFRNCPEVDFWLPNIVQSDDEARTAIRSMNLGTRIVSWNEQFGYRFMLSMDGNGAACQRLTVAMKSNGAVLKYNSKFILYYFHLITPWEQFIPIDSNVDVINAVRNTTLGQASDIAASGRSFVERLLNREASTAYAAIILQKYASLIG